MKIRMSEQGSTIKLTYEETKKLKKVLKGYLHCSDFEKPKKILHRSDFNFLRTENEKFALQLLAGLFE